ncbi:hypothetical protein [Streptomyces subrutilus]|uniref:hypothetical protein n=1 Tax=Streptomyces subrutilus TaxID=36818 RepID=UPI001431F26F|nr:hypothetical protein [Streptomyces subrutilus]
MRRVRGGRAGRPPNARFAWSEPVGVLVLKAVDTNLDVIAHAVGTCAQDLSSLRG